MTVPQMELLLNLVWLLVALASAAKFAVWSLSAGRSRRFVVAVATVCVLALLFPIISITDDLHMKKAVVEEARTIALVTAAAVVVVELVVIGIVHRAAVALPQSHIAAAVVERGPPV